jgi:hypothetical protein
MHSLSTRLPMTTPLVALALLVSACERPAAAPDDPPVVTVYLSPTCGCCGLWADYMEEEGFEVRRHEVPNIGEVRTRLGVPPMLGSCHTAVVGDYLVEGHVPAEDVRKLLAERPDAVGIAVPGMPIGSPGMEVPGRAPQAYETYLFTADGRARVFARH